MRSEQDDGFEPHHTSSPTDRLLTELQLYGWRPFEDEPDPRPLPEGNTVAAAVRISLGIATSEGDIVNLLSFLNKFKDCVVKDVEAMEEAAYGNGKAAALSATCTYTPPPVKSSL